MTLEPILFKFWVKVLCVASHNKGQIITKALPFYLRESQEHVETLLKQLIAAGLVDETDYGMLEPHNWGKRQFVSDGSAERVRRHRAKRAAAGLKEQWSAPKKLRDAVYERDDRRCVYCGSGERLSLDHRIPEIRGGTHDIENLATACLSCNGAKRDMTEEEYRASVTLLKRPQSTEQNISEQKDIPRAKRADREKETDEFEEWYQAYPLHKGRGAALRAYRKARTEAEREVLLTAAKAFARKSAGKEQQFIAHPATWLNQDRWLDEDLQPPKPQEPTSNGGVYVHYGTDQGDAWERDYRLRGKIPPRDSRGGWYHPSEYPEQNVSLKQSDQAA